LSTQEPKKRWVTYIAVSLDEGKEAETYKAKGVSYAEIFRTGLRACKKHFKETL
jgi:hypothetical protein